MEFASFDDYWGPYVGKEGPQAEYISTLSDVNKTDFATRWSSRTSTENPMARARMQRSPGR